MMGDEQLEVVHPLLEDVLGEVCDSSSSVARGYAEDLWLALHSSRANVFVMLPLLCCQAVGGETSRATPVAAAWYLLVLAARFLDDLEDQDMPDSLTTVLGPARALNIASSFILAAPLALAHLRRYGLEEGLVLDLLQDFQRTALRVCAGQHRDLTPTEVRLEDCWEIIAAKAGEPFALACRAGAQVGGGDARQVARLNEFGYHLGMLNQIGDDWSGIWNSSGRGDLAAGRRTLPILYALTVASEGSREHLRELLARITSDANAEAQARQMVCDLGALQYLLMEGESHRQMCTAALQAVEASLSAPQPLWVLLDRASPWSQGLTQPLGHFKVQPVPP